MNPDTNRFEALRTTSENTKEVCSLEQEIQKFQQKILSLQGLVRPNGEPVPAHWSVFTIGELVTIKNYTFKIIYMNEGTIVLEPVKAEDVLIK
jgi:hypothetical protein